MLETLNQHLFDFAAEGDPIGVRVARGFGADLFACDDNGDDAVTIAKRHGHDDIAREIAYLRGDHAGKNYTRH